MMQAHVQRHFHQFHVVIELEESRMLIADALSPITTNLRDEDSIPGCGHVDVISSAYNGTFLMQS